ncbi:MAG: RIP metalloprotease RseP, partial [Myxococcota bacterium]
EIGWIGLSHDRRDARVALPDPTREAGRAGLRSGDRVIAVEGAPIEGWEALEAAHRSASARTVTWQVERPRPLDAEALAALAEGERVETESDERTHEIPRSGDHARRRGVPATILVGSVSEGKPAARAGLRRGDLILAVDGEPVGSFRSFVALIQTSRGRELELSFAREGEILSTRLRAEEELVEGRYDIEAMAQKIYRIGLAPQPSLLAGPLFVQQVRNPLQSIPEAFAMTWDMTARYLDGLSRVFDGAVGADQISGPIGIARIARHSLDRGFEEYLFWIMLISINLGILNLLPIPILDGGQALIYSIEGIMRSPLSLRAREMANSFGFAVLVLLMGRAFWNDLTPFWSRFVDWLSGGTP